ncbi:hypothetical protein R3P38DRAFT_3291145 [Favolaschia claudopus]|uniref:Uncharacterized protein n=1 Tax=Favolaschia claudopus TaxID=2862362 RepID=A0AAV9ZPF4_9AGAR
MGSPNETLSHRFLEDLSLAVGTALIIAMGVFAQHPAGCPMRLYTFKSLSGTIRTVESQLVIGGSQTSLHGQASD